MTEVQNLAPAARPGGVRRGAWSLTVIQPIDATWLRTIRASYSLTSPQDAAHP
jgi:hypothetical protein